MAFCKGLYILFVRSVPQHPATVEKAWMPELACATSRFRRTVFALTLLLLLLLLLLRLSCLCTTGAGHALG
jgi:hypothetical protein